MIAEPVIQVLLVEDSPTDLLLTKLMLSSERFHVQFVERLADALNLLCSKHFDVVLLDLGLPDSDGLETLQSLRRENPQVAIVVLTGRDDEAMAMKALHEGAQDYLMKGDVEDGPLTRAIRYAVERNQSEKALLERTALAALTADVGLAFTGSGSLDKMLQACADSMVRNLSAAFARIWTLNDTENVLELRTSAGLYTHIDGPHSRVPVGKFKIGRIAEEKTPHLTNDVAHDPRVSDPEWARREGMVAFAGYPLLLENRLIGVMAMFARKPLSDTALDGLASVANQIALGIERKENDEALRRGENQLRELTEQIRQVLWVIDAKESKVLYVSKGYEEMWGRSCQSLIDNPYSYMDGIHPLDREMMVRENAAMFKTGYIDVESRILRPDGSVRWVWVRGYPVLEQQQLVRIVGVIEDVTSRKALQSQFEQAQKMEVVGRLAGGVAHDFNNMLAVIMGCCQLLENDAALCADSQGLVEDVYKAANRAAGLTRQLLAFSRQQVLQPKVLNMNEVVSEAATMLGRLIGEDIALKTKLHDRLWRVKADAGQMNQVIMNLAVNARDAIAEGGTITLETANTELDAGYLQAYPDVRPGRYVVMSVNDTGCGMDDTVKARIFEPFFTTKETGKGTGLGLATVFGIVKQSGGLVTAYSEPGIGTTFKVYLPKDETTPDVHAGNEPRSASPRGTETIMVVEDEDMVRSLACRILQSQGYEVLQAKNGEEALQVHNAHAGKIHLLLSDVVMPKIGGRELSDRLLAVQPGLKVLFMSGYTDDTVLRHGVLEAETNFIEKPFTYAALADTVRKILDR